ncbi:MAG TPA: ankyrin repeat domain-containing protein [Bryobacteraceae bacterium]|nr:ankyrin repeat domain-containing protein [Bryobacteraceae bacterium]
MLRTTATLLLAAGMLTASLESRLTGAAKGGDRTAVLELLKQKADPNAAEPDGTTALHWAAYQEDAAMVKVLIDAGAKVDAANRYGVTALSVACKSGNAKLVETLLKAGANVNLALPGGETPLMTASRTGKLEAVRTLLAHGADVKAKESLTGQSALIWAAAEGNAEVIEALAAAGADVNERLDSGFSPILFAAREGHIQAVKTLLKLGASANDAIPMSGRKRMAFKNPPRLGTTALMFAVANAHFDVAALLLDAGADPNAKATGYAALHVVTDVRKPGGGDNDPPPQGSGSMTSLEFVKRLVASGADINSRMTKKVAFGMTGLNTLGATAFLLAAKTADAELMRLLASLGADPLLPTTDGVTPLIAAAGLGTRSPGEDAGTESEVVEAVQVALELGNNIDAVDKNGETAMHGAAYKNLPAVVELLAARGANPAIWNQKNKFGWTPLRIAEGYRFGNYKPSPVTIAAFHRVMTKAGLSIPLQSEGGENISPYAKPNQ